MLFQGYSTTSAMYKIINIAWKRKATSAHNSSNCRYSSFKCKLNLRFMFIIRCKRHCKGVFVKKVPSKTCYTTSYI
ncbi:hypothetical protein HanRHA438_Chr14g0653361 [Helianthus annuus]|nr:hypothetical protein HanRHA438_Chr14g0653361 [Helianthus annuus]